MHLSFNKIFVIFFLVCTLPPFYSTCQTRLIILLQYYTQKCVACSISARGFLSSFFIIFRLREGKGGKPPKPSLLLEANNSKFKNKLDQEEGAGWLANDNRKRGGGIGGGGFMQWMIEGGKCSETLS